MSIVKKNFLTTKISTKLDLDKQSFSDGDSATYSIPCHGRIAKKHFRKTEVPFVAALWDAA